jgi:tRNA 2-thiouridine synthesizing protein A
LRILDVRGEICPVPLVETVREIEKMKQGEVLKVLSDAPCAKRTILLEMRNQGHKVQLIEKGKDFEVIIKAIK